ncbi:P-II family nitrogen regulator [Halalkalibacter kiskunsagensis]|uniref:P-II family nitrogen regulator n=1 Tax=Halalkalibacter kiskunsagensis TaxID=1548599 RepID=A0ABV6KI61_9BACI
MRKKVGKKKMLVNPNHKLVMTIVKKGRAKNVVKATKKAGAEGGTVLLGKGVGIHENKRFLGIPVEYEKEIVLSLVQNHLITQVVEAIQNEVRIEEPGKGLGLVIDLKMVLGICHLPTEEPSVAQKEDIISMPKQEMEYDLIVSIVNKGDSSKVVDASKRAGAEGGTIISGRGTGIHEQAKFLNIQIEPEKEIVLTLIDRKQTNTVLQAILEEAKLNKPGNGIAFVLDVDRTVGINHILNKKVNDESGN